MFNEVYIKYLKIYKSYKNIIIFEIAHIYQINYQFLLCLCPDLMTSTWVLDCLSTKAINYFITTT